MRTEDLVVALVADTRPVNVLASPARRFGRWLIVAVAAAAATATVIGVRADLGTMFTHGPLAREFVLVAMAAVLAGWAGFLSSVPGAAGARVAYVAALATGAAWAVAVVTRLASDGGFWAAIAAEPVHAACPIRIAVAAAVPGAAAWLMIRRAAPLARRRSAVLAALAAFAAGAASVQCMCPLDGAAHVLLWHVAPVVIGVGAMGLRARG